MSAQTRRRDCSTCKDPRKLSGNPGASGIFACPTCNRKYERKNREGAAADRVLQGLLVIPELRGSLRTPLSNPAGTASIKTCDRPKASLGRGCSDDEAQ
ncbi:MAG: hypothetical protein WDO69_32735 [Pseudomonadota bacterium]